MSIEKTNASAGTLLSDALNNVSSLIRNEIDLARAELSENLNRAGVAIGLIAGALVIAIVALTVLAAAVVTALTSAGMHAGWAALIVGGALAIVAFVMSAKGVNDLQPSSLAPTRTAKNLQRDATLVKEAYHD